MRGYCWTPSSDTIPKPDAHRLAGDALTAGLSRASVRLDVILPLLFSYWSPFENNSGSPIVNDPQLKILHNHVNSIDKAGLRFYFRPSWLPRWMTHDQPAYVGEIEVQWEVDGKGAPLNFLPGQAPDRVIRGTCWFDNPHYDDPSKANPADGIHVFNPDDPGPNGATDRDMIARGTWGICKTPDRPELRNPPDVESDKLAACMEFLAREFGSVVEFIGFGNEPDIGNFYPDIIRDGANGGPLGDTLMKYMSQIVDPAITAWRAVCPNAKPLLPDAAYDDGLRRCLAASSITPELATLHVYPEGEAGFDDGIAVHLAKMAAVLAGRPALVTESDGSIDDMLYLVEFLKTQHPEIDGPLILDPRLLVDGFEGDSPVMNTNGQRMRDLVARLDGVSIPPGPPPSAEHRRASGK